MNNKIKTFISFFILKIFKKYDEYAGLYKAMTETKTDKYVSRKEIMSILENEKK